jgi:hypothetical protein
LIRIYVAGAYSSDNVISILDNMRRGMRLGTEVFLKGYAPFVCWFDYHFQLMLRGEEKLSVEDYYNYSIAWLDVSNAVLVVPGSENSAGTQKEIERAKELRMPVFYNLKEMDDYFGS